MDGCLIFGVCCGIMATIITASIRLENKLDIIIALLESEVSDEDSN